MNIPKPHLAELGPEVLARIPVRNDHDGRYFSDPHQALPKDGYTSFFEKMLNNSKITVLTNTDYFEVKDKLKCKRLYYTGQIDTYFADLGWPKLEYRSLDFEKVVQKDTPGFFQAAVVVNHPQFEDVNGTKVDYTRIVEYKHLLNQTSNHTIYVIERSKDGGEPYYPVPNQENKDLYKKYQDMADKEEGVTFVGRLANYKYFNMDDAILNALELFDKDTKDMAKTKQVESDDAPSDKKHIDMSDEPHDGKALKKKKKTLLGKLIGSGPQDEAAAGESGTKSDAKDPSAIAEVSRVLEPRENVDSATGDGKSVKSDAEEKVMKVLESKESFMGATGDGKSLKSDAKEKVMEVLEPEALKSDAKEKVAKVLESVAGIEDATGVGKEKKKKRKKVAEKN